MNGKITLSNKLKGAVTMANTIINGGASPYPKSASGDIITITDGAENMPLKSAVVNIEPVQSGSGDPSPTNIRPISGWTQVNVTRAGINVWDEEWELGVFNNSTGEKMPNSSNIRSTNYIGIKPGKSYAFIRPTASRVFYYGIDKSFISSVVVPVNTIVITAPDNAYYLCFQIGGTTYNHDISINYPSTDHADHAYQGTPIAISLGQTVYGGTLDVLKGKLNAKPYYASYSGQTLVGPWISSHDKYVAGATPTTGAQVVDMGAAGTEYDVTPQTIKTLLGTNNIWADAESMEIEYYPAAASIVAVQNRSTKAYVSIPLGMIRYETYQITPQQTIDLDSYRSENGNLLRNPVATKCKLEFNTPLMTDTQWGEIWNIIKAGFNNNTERKLKLKYYDTLSASYKTGYFYVPDVQTTIRNIEEATGTINYNEIRLAFIEY